MTFGRQYLQWDSDSTAGTTTPAFQFRTDTTAGTATQSTFFEGPTYVDRWSAQTTTDTSTFRMSSFNPAQFTGLGELKHALMQIFKKVPEKLIKTEDDKKLVKAKEKSEKLLKDWLSPKEYQGFVENGEIVIPSEDDEEVIFIIKKDPNEMVDVKKKGEYQHKLCLVAEDMEYPVGDQLLSKLMMLKTDQKKFKELAIKH